MLATRLVRILVFTACVIILAMSVSESVYAGQWVVQPFFLLEDKGLFQPVVPALHIFPSVYTFIVNDPPFFIFTKVILPNSEIVFLPVGPPVRLFNLRPALSIANVQPLGLTDHFWVILADAGAGIGGLPAGAALQQASLFGNATGTEFVASITPINDLANLPTSSANNASMTWDLSGISQTTGNFFLAEATLPASEFTPEPSTFILFAVSILGVIGIGYRQRKKAVLDKTST